MQSDGEYLPGDEGCRGTSGIFTERLQDCGKGAETKQLTGELRNALNRQVSVDDKITFLEEICGTERWKAMNEPMLGSNVEVRRRVIILGAKREKGQPTDEEIARPGCHRVQMGEAQKKTIEEKSRPVRSPSGIWKEMALQRDGRTLSFPLMTRSGNTERKAIL